MNLGPGHDRRRSGLTLLEVILAVTLTISMMWAVLWFYDSAVWSRAAILRQAEVAAAERMVMDRLTDDLQNAVASAFLQTGLAGSAEEASFLATAAPGPAAWAKVESTQRPPPPESDLRLVSYRLRRVTDEQGLSRVVGLERAVQVLPSARQTEQSQQRVVLLTGRLRFLRLRYWDGQTWLDSWSGGDVPMAVEVAMGVEPLPEGTDPQTYPYELFRRTIYVPAGQKAGASRRLIGADQAGALP